MKSRYDCAKRVLDFLTATTMLLLSLPLSLVVMAVLKCTGDHKVFYTQDRIGYRNRPFRIIKFCSMREGSDKQGSVTVRGDPRVMPVGRLLRATKVNELPQLINVLLGDMSIVGPRPLVEEGFRMFPKEVQDEILADTKPGITGLGSVIFRNEEDILAESQKEVYRTYLEDIMPTKGSMELWYGRHKSIGLDLRIILTTAIRVIVPSSRPHRKLLRDLPPLWRDLS